MALTGKQEKFVTELIANGGNKIDAYRAAGYSQKMSPKSQIEQASKIFNSPNVYPRYQELKKEADLIAKQKFSISIEERLRRLDHLYSCGSEEFISPQGVKQYQNLGVAIKSVEVMNTMLGVDDGNNDNAESLNISFNIATPVKDVRVTRGS